MKSTAPPLPPSPEGEAALFVAALRLPELERTAFLDGACHGNTTLRLRLQALLAAHAQPDPNLALAGDDAPLGIGPSPSAELADDAVGQTLGRYKLVEKIGEGGCGVVYVAEQTQPVRRRVALKVIKPGMDSRQVVARFEAERQALAMMDHPNIAKILDAGMTGASDQSSVISYQSPGRWAKRESPTTDHSPLITGYGRPYFVMELVRGIRITDYCEQANLSTKERLDLFIEVCQAIQHAHQKGIIHRDIKPSNILVALHDGVPVPKVIDFGIAKATEGTLTDATVYTQLHQFIGTPAYMSPEQAEMSGLDIDTRSDIYSLGVLLYELLAGSTPFDAKELMASGIDAMRKTIREKEPVRPSTRLTQALVAAEVTRRTSGGAEESASSRRRLQEQLHQLKGDLDWIVMKCLEKERGRRYATANGLAADLRRHLNNEPVIARPPSAGYRFYKAWQRHKLAFVAGGSVAVALLAGIVASSWQALEANRARIGEKAQRLRADAENADARHLLYRANMNLAQQAWEQNDFGHLQQLLKEAEQSADRGFEWYYWQRQVHLPVKTLRGHLDGVNSAAFSPDGARIVTGGEDRIAQVWDAASGRKLATFRAYPAPIYSATFSPDGQWVANGGKAPHAVLWDAANGRQVRTFQEHSSNVWSVAFSADGQRIVGGCEDGTVKVWNTATGEQILTLQGHTNRIFSLAFSPDGRLIATGSLDRTARVWDAATGRELVKFAGHNDVIWGVAFSPDSQRVVTGSDDRLAKVWEVSSGRELLVLGGHGAGVGPVAFSPDGRRIATGSADRTIKIWEATTGQELATLKGHTSWLTSVAFSPDSQFIVSASEDKTAKVWGTAAQSAPLALEGHREWGRAAVAFSPDGQRIITVSQEVTATVWEVTTGRKRLTLRLPPDGFLSVAFSADGQRILTGSGGVDNPAKVWDAASGRELLTLKGHKAGVTSAAFSPDGRQILTGSLDNSAKLWDAANGRELLSLTGHTKEIRSVAFSHNGHRIATASRDNTAKVWDAVTGQQVLTFRGHSAGINSIAFSPDDLRIVTGSEDQTAKVWEPTTGRELATLAGHSVSVISVAFSPDGRRIVTGGVDGLGKVWAVRPDVVRAPVPLELLSLKGHMAGISAVAFSPDGHSIATAGGDQTVKVWEAASPQQVAAWRNEEATDAQYLESVEKQRNGEGP